MNTRDQFGSFLLLKKLGEDALGETFRAGKVGRGGLERVLLLRVFNGQGLDGGRLADHLEAQGPLTQALRSPNLGLCVDLGQVGRVPFVAYDYVSGRHLGALIEQARKRQSPISFDHALLIAERTAMGLAVAYETRFQGGRILHGFLVPHLIMVSNEGETRLLGFEAAGGLRGSAGHPLLRDAFARYLPPETLAGQAPHKADDVFSLGVLLYELITGERFVVGPQGPGALLAQATLAVEGSPVPPPVADLLRQSLAPRDQRLPDAAAWHKAISGLMADGHYNPTTFNLAFYMHSLFRDEIDRESQEIEAERTIRVTPEEMRAATAPAPAPAAPAPAAPAPARSLEEEYGLPGEAKAKKPLPVALIGGAAAAVVVLALGGWFLFGRSGEQAPADPAAAAAPAPGMTPEQIQALLDQALEQQRVQMQEGLKAASDKQAEEIKALQKQLEDAQRARAAGTATAAGAPPTPVTAPAAAPAGGIPAAATPVPATPTTVAAPTPAPAAATPAPQAATPPVPAAVTPIPVATVAPRPAPVSQMKVGDLIPGPGPGVVSPRVTRRAEPRYPPAARRMNREATVTVRVLVDEAGRVIDAQVPDKAGLGFDEAAIEAARATGYSPATKDGVAGRMWVELKIVFKLGR